MRIFSAVVVLTLGACVSPPDDLAGTSPRAAEHDGMKLEARASDTRAYSQIAGGPRFRTLSLFEASDLHRAAVRKATGCKAVNQVLPDAGRMTADLEC